MSVIGLHCSHEQIPPSRLLVSSDSGRHTAWRAELAELGFEEIHLHHVGQDLGPFIDTFGEHVLPELAA